MGTQQVYQINQGALSVATRLKEVVGDEPVLVLPVPGGGVKTGRLYFPAFDNVGVCYNVKNVEKGDYVFGSDGNPVYRLFSTPIERVIEELKTPKKILFLDDRTLTGATFVGMMIYLLEGLGDKADSLLIGGEPGSILSMVESDETGAANFTAEMKYRALGKPFIGGRELLRQKAPQKHKDLNEMGLLGLIDVNNYMDSGPPRNTTFSVPIYDRKFILPFVGSLRTGGRNE